MPAATVGKTKIIGVKLIAQAIQTKPPVSTSRSGLARQRHTMVLPRPLRMRGSHQSTPKAGNRGPNPQNHLPQNYFVGSILLLDDDLLSATHRKSVRPRKAKQVFLPVRLDGLVLVIRHPDSVRRLAKFNFELYLRTPNRPARNTESLGPK